MAVTSTGKFLTWQKKMKHRVCSGNVYFGTLWEQEEERNHNLYLYNHYFLFFSPLSPNVVFMQLFMFTEL